MLSVYTCLLSSCDIHGHVPRIRIFGNYLQYNILSCTNIYGITTEPKTRDIPMF